MYKVKDFIKWAVDKAGKWHYLFGSVRVMTTQATLDQYFKNYYSKQGYTRARFDELTRSWDRHGYATDCQGLCDAYLTFECSEPTDINADMNYRLWCTDKGAIAEIERPYVVGEAVFHSNGDRMTHVGWVCGFDRDGAPLAVEARGIAFGVVVTRLDGRSWTHRGLMTKVFDYTGDKDMIKFEVTSPMQTGEPFKAMQTALNLAGYTDVDGKMLEVDGKWGRRSQQAFDALIQDYAAEVVPEPDEPVESVEIEPIVQYTKGDHGEYTVLWFRTDDLPKEAEGE